MRLRSRTCNTYGREAAAHGLVLEWRLAQAEGIVLGLCWDRRGCLVVVRASTVAAL